MKNKKLIGISMAVVIAAGFSGVKAAVTNDRHIVDILESKYEKYPYLGNNISFKVQDGVVTLVGEVDNAEEKQKAEMIADNIDGVKEVESGITVDYDTAGNLAEYKRTVTKEGRIEANQEIKKDLDRAIFFSTKLRSEFIDTSVDNNGVATLTGHVDSSYEKDLATEKAMRAGAIDVNNQLEVRPSCCGGSGLGTAKACKI